MLVTEDVNGRRRVRTLVEGETRTKQSMKDETDINLIVRQYNRNGIITHLSQKMPSYDDMAHDNVIGHTMDLHAAMNFVKAAESAFMELPPELRKRFDNDPVKFVTFCDDPENQDEMVKLGLADPVKIAERRAAEGAAASPGEREAAPAAKTAPEAPAATPEAEASPE